MYPAIAMGALSVLQGLGAGAAARRAARNQEKLAKAEMYADTVTREANNISRAAGSSLADFVRSLNNQRVSKAAGEQYNYLGENMMRVMEQSTSGTFSRRIEAAEQAGAIAAQNAWAGIGGATADMIDGTMALRDSIIDAQAEQNQNYMTYDMVRQRAGVVSSGIESLDFTQAFAGIDTKSSIQKHVHKPGWDNILTSTALGVAPTLIQGLQNYWDAQKPAAPSAAPVATTSFAVANAGPVMQTGGQSTLAPSQGFNFGSTTASRLRF